MPRSKRGKTLAAAVLATALLTSGQLAAWSASPAPRAPSDARRVATDRLQAEGSEGLRLTRDTDGTVSFVGAAAGEAIVNPAVARSTRLRAAARAHLDRYGAAFGTTRQGNSFGVLGTRRTASHQDTVRFQQSLGGVPVIGGEVVVAVRPDRQLGSVLASLSSAAPLPPATVTRQHAARIARRAVAATVRVRHLPVRAEGRWVWDPQVLGAASPYGARGVWRFTVGDRISVHREVLVDDRTGAVLLHLDANREVLDRIVCDRANVPGSETTCTPAAAARTEASGTSGVTDVNAAFDHAGSVSALYQAAGGVDLTTLLGVNVSGTKKLATTVRYCDFSGSCPYANAFWNGTQMYYGQGFAVDDVVGHEMTHGVIARNADLFYWGQSGAINESLADIMGEIVDHRSTLVGEDASWPLGEDLATGPSRSLSNPPALGQPDRMTSVLWDADTFGYFDNGGVHTNSGVGNKAAHLISQGGTFNGQTITGIDSDDALTRTAELYYDVIVRLTSGSDYANLADVLEQTCQDFVGGGLHGFTQDHCTNIGRAITATQMRTTPTQAPQPSDAPQTCPAGVTPRLLFDSEAGSPAASFVAGSTWGRDNQNATSGQGSWFSDSPSSTVNSPLTATTAVALPAGQLSYLWFQHWRLLDYVPGTYYDGGTVELDDVGDSLGLLDTSSLPWVNGPVQTLHSPNAGRRAFGGDSLGWLASRADLSAYAGRSLKTRFTMRTDSEVSYIGWWLDDIRIYTCDGVAATPGASGGTPEPTPPPPPPPVLETSAATAVKVKGGLGKAVVTWQPPVTSPAAVASYRVATGDTATTVPATERRAVLKALANGKTHVFTVTPATNGGFAPATSVTAKGTKVTLKVDKAAGKTVLRGKLAAGSTGLKGMVLKVLLEKKGGWVKVGKVKTTKGGKYTLRVSGTSRRSFRVRFTGALGLMGAESAKRRL